MTFIDIERIPSRRDLVVFSLIFLAFFALLGWLTLQRPHLLQSAGGIAGLAFVISFLLNEDYPRRTQLAGLALPFLLLTAASAARLLPGSRLPVVLMVGVGAAGALLINLSSKAGRRVHAAWMRAIVPVGWTLSHLLLAVVYYGVLTPTGWVMRSRGHDPLRCRQQARSESYWVDLETADDSARYFRQF